MYIRKDAKIFLVKPLRLRLSHIDNPISICWRFVSETLSAQVDEVGLVGRKHIENKLQTTFSQNVIVPNDPTMIAFRVLEASNYVFNRAEVTLIAEVLSAHRAGTP